MGISLKPSEFVEGGVVPVDRNLLWTKCRFTIFEYKKRDGTVVATTTSAEIDYKDDDGQEYKQNYSVGDPERFIPSQDGKTLIAVGSAEALSKSSNFYLLLNALVNAGFPENKLEEDISSLDGLYTYNIGMPEPKRSGLVRQAEEGARERSISVPSQVLRLPWEKGKGATKAAPATADKEAEEADEDVVKQAIEFVGKNLVDGKVTRQQLAVAVFKDLANDPNKDAIATLIFTPAFGNEILPKNGYLLTGEEISKA